MLKAAEAFFEAHVPPLRGELDPVPINSGVKKKPYRSGKSGGYKR
jgi:hypothetical protein